MMTVETWDDATDVVGRPSPLAARLAEAEDQCRLERAKRVELAVLVAGFLQRVAPLVAETGISLDIEVSQ